MKKIVMTLAIAAMAMGATAQTTSTKNYAGSSRFTDNWSVGIHAGTTEQLVEMDHFTPTLVIDADKYITPWFGVGIDARLLFGTRAVGVPNTHSHYIVAQSEGVDVYAKFNLANLFLGYKGTRRFFEPVAYTGLGWQHYNCSGMMALANQLNKDNGTTYVAKRNQAIYRAGVEFNFNLGKSRAWAIQFNPSVAWGSVTNGRLDRRSAAYEMTLGAVYHFKTSNGTHDFAKASMRNEEEIFNLNQTITKLREDNNNQASQLRDDNNTITALRNTIDQLNKAPKQINTTTTNSTNALECYVYFNQGKTAVAAAQLPNVERIATFLKHNDGSSVVVKGYASPEGSAEVNQKIAQARAESVKTLLVNKYKISADRISAEGQGVGNSFSEPDWNRVSICTIQKNDTKTTTTSK